MPRELGSVWKVQERWLLGRDLTKRGVKQKYCAEREKDVLKRGEDHRKKHYMKTSHQKTMNDKR